MTIINAAYDDRGLPQTFKGNPFIEALPGIMSDAQIMELLKFEPNWDESSSRSGPAYMRIYEVETLDQIFVPPVVCIDYARQIDILIRRGYECRNPLCPAYISHQYKVQALMKTQGGAQGTLSGIITLKATSGMGKTRLTRRILSAYPQVIVHKAYGARQLSTAQVVWLSVEAPIAGSMKGFMLSLFQALDEALEQSNRSDSYSKSFNHKAGYGDLMNQFVQLAATHSLGILHIDDIQRIGETSSDREHVLQLIIRLANVAQFGMIFTGTKDISDVIRSLLPRGGSSTRVDREDSIFQQQFEVSRRMMNRGYFEIRRPPSSKDRFFISLVKKLFEFQWLAKPLALDDVTLQLIFDLTAGIPALVVLLHKQAQFHALSLEADDLTQRHYLAAYKAGLKPLSPLLKKMRKKQISVHEFESKFEAVFSQLSAMP